MPRWLRGSLYGIILTCCLIMGAGLYLNLQDPNLDIIETGNVANMPELMPDFSLGDINGETRTISEWSGQPLLLNFWATWCAPCRREIPLLQSLHLQKETAGIQVIGVAIDRLPDVQAFVGEYGVSYPNLVGEEDAMAASDLFGLSGLGLPFSVLAGSNGRLLMVHVGEISADQLLTIVSITKDYESGGLELEKARSRLRIL